MMGTMPSEESFQPKPSELYTDQDVRRWFDDRTLSRAGNYSDAIRHLAVLPELIMAHVQGTESEPYHVKIQIHRPTPRSITIDAECSCPVGFNCKHAAAVLYAALRVRDQGPRANPYIMTWIEHLADKHASAPLPPQAPTPPGEAIHYLFEQHHPAALYHLTLHKGEITERKLKRSIPAWRGIEAALRKPPRYLQKIDVAIFRALLELEQPLFEPDTYVVDRTIDSRTLESIIASGRAWLKEMPKGRERTRGDIPLTPLTLNAVRTARLEWKRDVYGYHVATLHAPTDTLLLLSRDQIYYLDPATGEVGRIGDSEEEWLLGRLMQLPPLNDIDATLVASALATIAPHLAPPTAREGSVATITTPPVAVLHIDTHQPLRKRGRLSQAAPAPGRDSPLDYAVPQLSYGNIEINPDEVHPFYVAPDGRVVRITRDIARERQLMEALKTEGLQPLGRIAVASHHLPEYALGFKHEEQWRNFVIHGMPRLREAGWQIGMPDDFRHYIVRVDEWEMVIDEEESGWLDLDMGIMVEGERLALAPLLHTLFYHEQRWLDAKRLAAIDDREEIFFTAPSGVRFTLPAGRLKPLASTLIDLFDGRPAETLRLPRHDALRLAQMAEQAHCRVRGGESALQLAERIKHAGQVKAVAQPPGFGLTLRPYQLEGLAWLHYLREQQLGGILADDMGLGKTAQTLAHLLSEKLAGHLDRPSLIVMPTTLVFNWLREVQRFAPDLRVLTLHGKDRAEAFASIPHYDICITTYPLLWRDEAQLIRHEYHYVILDEAQSVKNAMSRSAAVVRKLTTRHRLCITGTPLENNLGELWSQFDFLMPGFLGDSKQFTATWRKPIEKMGNLQRRAILAKRVAPFILRRRKEDVAKELPPKTIIVRDVELTGAQRDLYETVRSAMDEQVRNEIAARGFNRSQIVILDALLKLRQVCCDPRLLKTTAAARVRERAKLELLMEMVPELISEGRRILLFSQFTSMLGLIEEELQANGIDYVKLTGATRDREEVVNRFQAGEVPLFLISLKAGGTGLNLTAADTVIHYDPWWNPAVENQATDRAHRIGQQKPVFVYKLVVAGSIEEKILALQEKKAELAAGILSEDSSALAKFSENDIHALLTPLPSDKKRTDRR